MRNTTRPDIYEFMYIYTDAYIYIYVIYTHIYISYKHIYDIYVYICVYDIYMIYMCIYHMYIYTHTYISYIYVYMYATMRQGMLTIGEVYFMSVSQRQALDSTTVQVLRVKKD